ncbi:MAG TPA: hypothetical protein VHG29_09725 [Novosphingobium sp.]|nr:hypothetical protein [Novosphingobium sp.]
MTISPPIRILAALTGAALLSACADDAGGYPSLARRPAERVSGTSEVVPAVPVTPPLPAAPPSAELSAKLAGLVQQAGVAHRRFTSREAHARGLVSAAAGAAVASESWAVATVALADLESARSDAMIALADLDQLYAAQRIEGADAVATGAAREAVIALVAQEDLVLASLRGKLRA